MSFTNDDAGDLLEQLAQTRAERDAFKRALIEHAGALAAAQFLGSADYGPIVANSLAVDVSDKGITIKVTDSAGRARTKFNSVTGKFAAFTTADLAAEFTAKWPQLARAEKSSTPNDTADHGDNLTERMRRERAERRTAGTNLSDAERTAARARNPWSGPHFNLTEAMRIEKRDPQLAGELKAAAGVAA